MKRLLTSEDQGSFEGSRSFGTRRGMLKPDRGCQDKCTTNHTMVIKFARSDRFVPTKIEEFRW